MTDSLDMRLHRLERHNRWLALALGVLVSVFLLGATGRDASELRAEAFHVTAADGRIVATLGVAPEGPGLFIKDSAGRNRVAITHETEQTGLRIVDASGDTRIGVVQFSHGGGGVALHGKDMKGAAVLYLKGEGRLTFHDAEGAIIHREPPAPED